MICGNIGLCIAACGAGAFFGSIMQRLQVRFYSISSSPLLHPKSIHITCAVVYEKTATGTPLSLPCMAAIMCIDVASILSWMLVGCSQTGSLQAANAMSQAMSERRLLLFVPCMLSSAKVSSAQAVQPAETRNIAPCEGSGCEL